MDLQNTTSNEKLKDNLPINQPGVLRVIKREGHVVNFDENRIKTAIKNAFLATKGAEIQKSDHIQNSVSKLSEEIFQRLKHNWCDGGILHIEAIQDIVELTLMRAGEHKVARHYVLYREERRKKRLAQTKNTEQRLTITLNDGSSTQLDHQWLSNLVNDACSDLSSVKPSMIISETEKNLYNGVKKSEIYKALVMSSRALVENEPNYSQVTARLLLHSIYESALGHFNLQYNWKDTTTLYQEYFPLYIENAIRYELLSPDLEAFDLDLLIKAIQPSRDKNFGYLGIQTLYDRYFIHKDECRIELPQAFFMRVAMGLAHSEGKQKNQKAIEFYELISQFDYMSSTPTLFNSGTLRQQLSSCYLTTVPDDLSGIYGAIKDNALLSKFAGGLGNDWTPVRAMGSRIKGTNGKSLGVVPFLNVADATAVAVNQGGKRKGAVCAYLETWHLDIEEFLDLRKNTGDDRRRTHDMNTANWVPDLFMERVFEEKDWTLFSPNDVPELHETYGDTFRQKYEAYEAQAANGTIYHKTIPAKKLWRKMLSMLFETGHPWITFKDPCNLRSPQQHAGVVHSSNLCTEITLNTSDDEIAVCNLGSINLSRHMKDGKLNKDKLEKTIKTAIRMLDNVIDINYYSVPQAENSNLKHRPIGLGVMGFQDALYQQRIPYASDEAVKFADECMEVISYCAISASSDLAKERGTYKSYNGSLWDQGIFPIDSIANIRRSKPEYFTQNTEATLDWKSLKEKVNAQGMRNSNVMAIAPTATISNICGVTQSIEPTYQNLFVKYNLSGEFTVVNPYLINDLKSEGLWDNAMIHDLKYYHGNLKEISRVPDTLKELYATAFEIEPRWLVESASRRQKWIDQAQSLNLYMAQPSGKKLDLTYRMCWTLGLKTTYYLRSLGASNAERATVSDQSLNSVKLSPKACSINDPDCEACQ
jgi:ribonucleoside-diphosphate reductase alpha chain